MTLESCLEAGIGHLNGQRFEEAEAAFRGALELNEGYAPAHANLGMVLLVLKRHEEAASHLRRAIELDPRLVEAHLNLGGALLVSGDLAGAEAAFLKGTQLDPEQVDIFYNLGVLYTRTDQPEKAKKAFERVCQLQPVHGQAAFMLGITHLVLRESYPAAANLMVAMRMVKGWMEAQVALAEAWRQLGRYQMAKEELEAACKRHPKATAPKVRLALLLAEMGEQPRAITLLHEVWQRGVQAPELIEVLALLLENQGKSSEARELFEKLLLDNPENEAAKEGLERLDALASASF